MDSVLQLTSTTQRKCSGWMNNKTKHWTQRQTKVYLVLFCVVFICGSAFIVWDSFSSKKRMVTIPIGKLPVLPALNQTTDIVITEKEIADILAFSRYLDSLQQTPEGKKQFEELVQDRPGLIDSLATIQQFLIK